MEIPTLHVSQLQSPNKAIESVLRAQHISILLADSVFYYCVFLINSMTDYLILSKFVVDPIY